MRHVRMRPLYRSAYSYPCTDRVACSISLQVSLGEHGLIEFVQLNAQHEPQLIWYRPIHKTANPWATN